MLDVSHWVLLRVPDQLGAAKWEDGLKRRSLVQMLRKQVGISCRESQYRGAEVGLMGGGSRRMKEENEGRKIDGR